MQIASRLEKSGHHNNAFGALRLLFASLVILAHTPEIIDGTRSREPLSMIFGTMSFGEFAVICFFIISGYLISASFINSSSIWSYSKRRIARIYPGFVVVFLLCIFVVAPLGGAQLPRTPAAIGRMLIDCALLQMPTVEGAFAGRPWPQLNGSLWTIAYEFRCYIMVIALGMAGVLTRRHMLLGFTLVMVALALAFPIPPHQDWNAALQGAGSSDVAYGPRELFVSLAGIPRLNFRLMSAFLAGACFYAYRDRVRFSRKGIAIAAAGLIASLFSTVLALSGTIVFGGYLIFATAAIGGNTVLGRINNENDVSYGVYLYAWPLTKLLDWWVPGTSLLVMIVAVWVLSWACGWASWVLVERPVMQAIRARRTA